MTDEEREEERRKTLAKARAAKAAKAKEDKPPNAAPAPRTAKDRDRASRIIVGMVGLIALGLLVWIVTRLKVGGTLDEDVDADQEGDQPQPQPEPEEPADEEPPVPPPPPPKPPVCPVLPEASIETRQTIAAAVSSLALEGAVDVTFNPPADSKWAALQPGTPAYYRAAFLTRHLLAAAAAQGNPGLVVVATAAGWFDGTCPVPPWLSGDAEGAGLGGEGEGEGQGGDQEGEEGGGEGDQEGEGEDEEGEEQPSSCWDYDLSNAEAETALTDTIVAMDNAPTQPSWMSAAGYKYEPSASYWAVAAIRRAMQLSGHWTPDQGENYWPGVGVCPVYEGDPCCFITHPVQIQLMDQAELAWEG